MTKPKVLITQKIFDEAVVLVKEHFEVDYNASEVPLSSSLLVKRLQGKSGAITLLTDSIDEALLSQCPDLKIVSNVAVGYNNIDVDACTRHGVMVTNTPGVLDETTADFTWTLIMAAARRLVESDVFLRSSRWKGWGLMQFLGHDVHHKTLGICGLGRIGQGVARRARGFEMKILYTDAVRAAPSIEESLGVQFVEKKVLLAQSDFVTLHVPLTPQTTHYISTEELELMKPTSLLINASRGPVVDEKALVKALQSGKIAGAGLDVYEKEPQVEPALMQMTNVVLAPHIASASGETRLRMATMAAENMIAGLMGRRPPNLVNKKSLGEEHIA
jgi:lactate dehydrogenase-like 2-hydroxyacid dehydrogenase